MIILTDRILRQAGLTLAEAKALLAPVDAELVVHIRQELDPFSSPAIESLDGAHDPDSDQPDPPAARLSGDLNRRSAAPAKPQASTNGAGSHRETAATPTDSTSVEDHGYSLGTAKKLAASYDMTLTYEGGLYTLTSAFGRQPYTSLADAVACIKQYGRWRDAVRQTIDTQTRRLR